MTIKAKVCSYLGFAPNKEAVESALQDVGLLNQDATYDPASADTTVLVKKAAVALMDIIFSTPDINNENGYVIRYDRNALLKQRNKLAAEVGLPQTGAPVIRAPKVW